MQVFRLVNQGSVDKVIAFDSLPTDLLKTVRTRDIAGLPRYWGRWLTENGCTRPVFETGTEVLPDRNLKVTQTPIGTEPCFYLLDYVTLNADKEKWQEISDYLRRNVDPSVRLKDRIENDARPMAKDCYSELSLDPEDIPVIKVDSNVVRVKEDSEIVGQTESLMTPTGEIVAPKKRGRPKKIAAEV
jgi:hypothetical protein